MVMKSKKAPLEESEVPCDGVDQEARRRMQLLLDDELHDSDASTALSPQALATLRSLPPDDCPVEYTLHCVQALAPELEEWLLGAAESQVREQYGGERVYIGKRRGQSMSDRNAQIRRLYQRGERVAFIARKFGLSRFRVHAILNLPAA